MTDISRRDLVVGGGLLLAGSSATLSAFRSHDPHAKEFRLAFTTTHDWVKCARVLIAEAYVPPFYPQLDYDPERAVRIAKDLNANAFRFPAASYFAYFPTRSNYPVHPQLREDPMRETFRLCRAANLKTIAYIPLNHPFMDVKDNNPLYPSWQRVDAAGRPFVTTHFGFSRYYEGCLNSPLRQEIVLLVKEVLEYDVDLIYFDGPYQGMDHRAELCHCRWCQAAFKKATGHAIPTQNGDPDAAIEYMRWMDDEVANGMLQELTDMVHTARDLPVLFNNTSMLNRGWCRSRSIAAADGFMFEAAETPEQKLFNLQLGHSTGKVIWTYVGYHSQYNREHLRDKSIRGWYSYPLDEDDLLMDGAVALAANAGIAFWSLNRLYSMPHPPTDYAEGGNIRTIFGWMEENEELLRSTQSSPQAGLLVSSQSIEWCHETSYIPTAYPNGFRGIGQVMQQGSITAEPFLDFAMQRHELDRYRLIFVSNAVCLSEAQCAMLEDFVVRGGTLIATHLSGLCDEYGRAQKHRPLHDLLGIEFTKDEPEERPELYLTSSEKGDLIPQDPQIMRFQLLEGTTALTTTYDLAHREKLGAAVTHREHGKGHALYIGSNLEAIYDESHLRVVRDFLLRLLEPYLGSSRRYRVTATEGLIEQYAESRTAIVLHLIANTGDKGKNVRASESYLPLTNVAVALRIPAGTRVSSVHLLYPNRPAAFTQDSGWIHLVISRIYIHETIVVALG